MHYVMSDIHGHYQEYLEMLDIIKFSENDHLYIIGDIIDKGPDSARLLLDIMNRPNVTLLLGNHEYMLLNAINLGHDMHLWLINGGDKTIDQMLAIGLEYRDVVQWLSSCPVLIPNLCVNNQWFHLCHAGYCPSNKRIEAVQYMQDFHADELEFILWNRYNTYFYHSDQMLWLKSLYPGTIFLMGHTPVHHTNYARWNQFKQPMVSITEDGLFINLDCGCASNKRLGCICLEDFSEYYVNCTTLLKQYVA